MRASCRLPSDVLVAPREAFHQATVGPVDSLPRPSEKRRNQAAD